MSPAGRTQGLHLLEERGRRRRRGATEGHQEVGGVRHAPLLMPLLACINGGVEGAVGRWGGGGGGWGGGLWRSIPPSVPPAHCYLWLTSRGLWKSLWHEIHPRWCRVLEGNLSKSFVVVLIAFFSPAPSTIVICHGINIFLKQTSKKREKDS